MRRAVKSWLVMFVVTLLSGLIADAIGLGAAIHVVAVLTLASGLVVATTLPVPAPTQAATW